MTKVKYFTILMAIWYSFCRIKPIGSLSSDMLLIIVVLYMLFGFFYYRRDTHLSYNSQWKRPYKLIVMGILLSMVSAFFVHNQGFLQSIITYRSNLYWAIIPLLFYVSPSEDEVLKIVKYTVFFLISMFVLKHINLSLFVIPEKYYGGYTTADTYAVPGQFLSTILIFYSLMRFRETGKIREFLIIGICYAFIYLNENRSTLFPITLIIGYVVIFSGKNKWKILYVPLFLAIAFFVYQSTQEQWISLISTAGSQISSEDYARNAEIAYYLSDAANPSPITYVLGNGIITKHGNLWVSDLSDNLFFNSDVGFVGFWNYFGVLPVMVFIYTMLLAIVNKSVPYYLKLWSLQLLSGALTISYFYSHEHMMFYALFFYLLYLNIYKTTNYQDEQYS